MRTSRQGYQGTQGLAGARYSLKLKNLAGTDVSYNGSADIDLRTGTYISYISNVNKVVDRRGATRFPNYFSGNSVHYWFNNTGTPTGEWWSGIHVHGWTTTAYHAWELAGPASTTNSDHSLKYRTGKDATWNSWRTVLDSSNYITIADTRYVKKAGDTMTGVLTMAANNNAYISLPLTARQVKTTSSNVIHAGGDTATSTDANFRFGSWYGIGWYPTISGQTVAQGNNAMWLNVRTGILNVYSGIKTRNIKIETDNSGGSYRSHEINNYTSTLHLQYNTPNNVAMVQGGGKVGVGISPSERLHVSGNVLATGYFKSTVATGTAPYQCSSITMNPNLNADLLDGWHINMIIKDSYSSVNSSSTGWQKVWDMTLNNQSNDVDITLYVHSAYNNKWGFIALRLRQQGPNTARNIYAQLYQIVGNLDVSHFRLYYNNASGLCQLWCNRPAQWFVYNFRVITSTWRVGTEAVIGTYYSSASNGTTLPGDSYVACTSIGLANGATSLNTTRYIFGQPFNGTQNVQGLMTSSSIFVNSGDATLKIYSSKLSDGVNDGNIAFQTSFDGTDGQSHTYPGIYQARCNIVLQPRGGQVYIGTNPSTGNTSYKLYVAGAIYATTTINAGSTMSSTGFRKSGSSDSYVLLGGGGHKAMSQFIYSDYGSLGSNERTNNSDSYDRCGFWRDNGIGAYGITMMHSQSTLYKTKLYHGYGNDGNIYVKAMTNGVWGPVYTLYSTYNLNPGLYVKKAGDTMTGNLIFNSASTNCLVVKPSGRIMPYDTNRRDAGMYGVYDSYKIGQIWSMGESYKIPNNGANFGNLYGLAYKHTNNSTGGTLGGGHQMIWCTNGAARGAIGESYIWALGGFYKNGSSNAYCLTGAAGHIKYSTSNEANVLVQRGGAGDIFGRYYNSAIGDENFTIGSVYVRNTTDTYIRKMTWSNFMSKVNSAHSHGFLSYQFFVHQDSVTTTNFRTQLFGTSSSGAQMRTWRWNAVPALLSGMGSYGSAIIFAGSDTHGFLALDYNRSKAKIGAGNGNNINWTSFLLTTGDYAGTLDGRYMTLATTQTVSGVKTVTSAWSFSNIVNFTNGTRPFNVTGKGVVTNLNADMLDGLHADFFIYRRRYNNLYLASASINGPMPPFILAYKNGFPLYDDPEFAIGTNSVKVYNNAGNGTVTISRVAQANGNSSGYVLRIICNAGGSPGVGGWYFGDMSVYARQYTYIFRANVPSGRSVQFASNSTGSGSQTGWLTDRAGTGKYEWYAYTVYCGTSGFSSTGYFYIEGSTACTWYLAYANCYINSWGKYDGLLTKFSDKSYQLNTTRYLWGQAFNGTQNVTGNLSSVGSISMSGNITSSYFYIQTSSTNPYFRLTNAGYSGFWHIQSYQNALRLGPTSGKGLSIFQSGEVTSHNYVKGTFTTYCKPKPGMIFDFYVYYVNGKYASSNDYTVIRDELFDSTGRGKTNVSYTVGGIAYTNVDLSDYKLAVNAVSGYYAGYYIADAGGYPYGESTRRRVGSSISRNYFYMTGRQMPYHAHWFSHHRGDNANDRDHFGPSSSANHSVDGRVAAGQGGNWRTGYSGNGEAIDTRPSTFYCFKIMYSPTSASYN